MVGTDTLITWLGHASFKIEADDKIIYIDPYEGDYQEKADFILVTHSHHDHCDVAKIAEARKESSVVVAPSDCALKIGGTVESLQPGKTLTVESGHRAITGLCAGIGPDGALLLDTSGGREAVYSAVLR